MPYQIQQLAGISLITAFSLVLPQSALAQSEVWLLGPNSRTGQQSTVVPTDCVEGSDGSITCNTKIENPPGDTPAKPYYNPFSSN
ncbi:hypothetical protein ACLM45_00165 [Synechococcus sp. A10-1-5-9]|uniref:hypothetical protein n=1 Tax=Synechococcus sp. A10-1-5-9 TaxID=3392295 RepID=UPI0039EB5260